MSAARQVSHRKQVRYRYTIRAAENMSFSISRLCLAGTRDTVLCKKVEKFGGYTTCKNSGSEEFRNSVVTHDSSSVMGAGLLSCRHTTHQTCSLACSSKYTKSDLAVAWGQQAETHLCAWRHCKLCWRGAGGRRQPPR